MAQISAIRAACDRSASRGRGRDIMQSPFSGSPEMLRNPARDA